MVCDGSDRFRPDHFGPVHPLTIPNVKMTPRKKKRAGDAPHEGLKVKTGITVFGF